MRVRVTTQSLWGSLRSYSFPSQLSKQVKLREIKLQEVESEGDEIKSYQKSKVMGEKNPNINLEIQSE